MEHIKNKTLCSFHNPELIQSHLPHQVIQVHPDGKLGHGRECMRKNRVRYSAQTISLLEENMAVFLTTTQWSTVRGGGEECMLAQLPTIWLVSGPLWAVDGQWLVSSAADVPISPSSLRSLPMSSITKNFSEDTATYLKSDEIELLRDSYCIYLLVFWCMGQGLKLPESQLYRHFRLFCKNLVQIHTDSKFDAYHWVKKYESTIQQM